MSFDRALLPDPVSYFENQGLPLRGPLSAKWKTTTCNFHGGSDSMRVNVKTGAWVCMSCGEKGGDVLAYEIKYGGCEFMEAAKALGCWVNDGRPNIQKKPTPLSPRLALSAMSFEATIAAIAASNLANGVSLAEIDLARLRTAANRIIRLVEAFE
jgi:CHC2 zinc finger